MSDRVTEALEKQRAAAEAHARGTPHTCGPDCPPKDPNFKLLVSPVDVAGRWHLLIQAVNASGAIITTPGGDAPTPLLLTRDDAFDLAHRLLAAASAMDGLKCTIPEDRETFDALVREINARLKGA